MMFGVSQKRSPLHKAGEIPTQIQDLLMVEAAAEVIEEDLKVAEVDLVAEVATVTEVETATTGMRAEEEEDEAGR